MNVIYSIKVAFLFALQFVIIAVLIINSNKAMDSVRARLSTIRTRVFWTLLLLFAVPMTIAILMNGSDIPVALVFVCNYLLTMVAASIASTIITGPVYKIEQQYKTKLIKIELSDAVGNVAIKKANDDVLKIVNKDIFRHLSHQLKAPMALLRAHSQLAQKNWHKGNSNEAGQNLIAIEEIALSVGNLVEQLISMAWVDGLSNQVKEQCKVNLSSEIMKVVKFYLVAANNGEITIQTDVNSGLWVIGEKYLLFEMISSVVDNAIRYSPKGSTINIEANLLPNTNVIALIVTDQGRGISINERSNVFKPWYGSIGVDELGDPTYGSRQHQILPNGMIPSSHGLGLSLVQSIAKLHGADVALTNGKNNIGLSVRMIFNASTPPVKTNIETN